jgi:hypothetical protein
LLAVGRLGSPISNDRENKHGSGGTGENGEAHAISDDGGKTRSCGIIRLHVGHDLSPFEDHLPYRRI